MKKKISWTGSWEKERRLDFIDDNFAVYGTCPRQIVHSYFQISVPQVSLDFREYRALKPKIYYDNSNRLWKASPNFESVRNSTKERILAWSVFEVN